MAPTTESWQRQLAYLKDNLNQEYKVVMALWIIFMQCGFALVEAGSVRSKNTTNILFKNFMDMFVGALSYWIFGYGFAFGIPGNAFIGHNFFFSTAVAHEQLTSSNTSTYETNEKSSSPDELLASEYYSSWFFQFAFAATSSTIVSGAMAERTQFVAYLIYSFAITAFIYPILSHWCWSEIGFLHTGAGLGVTYIDFGGSGVVHITGGMAALVGAKLVGPRIGRFPPIYEESRKDATMKIDAKNYPKIQGHSVPLASMGGFILFVAFLAFNSGSQKTVTNEGDGVAISMAATNTVLAGASGGLTALVFHIVFEHLLGNDSYLSLLVAINGSLTGMVSACAGSNQLFPWASMLLGCISSMCMIITDHLLQKHRIDDPIGAISVHLTGGIIGVVLTPIFVIKGMKVGNSFVGGIINGGHEKAFASFGWNLFAAVCILTWTGLNCAVLFGVLKLVGLLRVTAEEETAGLDIIKHGEPAYPENHLSNDRKTFTEIQPDDFTEPDRAA